MSIEVRKLDVAEVDTLVSIYSECFPKEIDHKEWLQANIQAFPRMIYYIALFNHKPVGYALWSVKSGFRPSSIVELEQLAVLPDFAGKGFGRELLQESFGQFKAHLNDRGIGVKAVYVSTREGNFAEKLYASVFAVERHGVIKNYGSGDEVILFKRFA